MSVESFVASEEGRLTRLALMAMAAWVYRKHIVPTLGYPWRLCSLGDDRVPKQDKERIAKSFEQASECCLPKGIARGLKNVVLQQQTC